jgi:hypothetical protein
MSNVTTTEWEETDFAILSFEVTFVTGRRLIVLMYLN